MIALRSMFIVRRVAATLTKWGRRFTSASYVLTWMGIVEVGVRLRRFSEFARRIGVPLHTGDRCATSAGTLNRELSARQVQRLRILNTLSPWWPFGHGPCLRHALVAGRILREMGPVLRIGVSPSSSSPSVKLIVAHAWIEVDGIALDRDSEDFLPLLTHRAVGQP